MAESIFGNDGWANGDRPDISGRLWFQKTTGTSDLQRARKRLAQSLIEAGLVGGPGNAGVMTGRPAAPKPAAPKPGVPTPKPGVPVPKPGLPVKPGIGGGPGNPFSAKIPVPGPFRYLDMGYGLTWQSREDMSTGQELEDELGEMGSVPAQFWKLSTETLENIGRLFNNIDFINHELSTGTNPLPVDGTGMGGWDRLVSWDKQFSQSLHDLFGTGVTLPGGSPKRQGSDGRTYNTGGGF